jgi:hypothetical protein
LFEPEIIKEVKRQLQVVRENLKVAQSRQKSYADTRLRELTFQEGEFVYLKVSLSEVCTDSKSKGSSHLVTLARSGSWNGKAR